ncbi:ATP-binding protein [Gemmatimonadota bacterium]
MSAGILLDQKRARRLLEQALSGGEIPPAFLFVGPHGTGKEEAALGFAKTLNCSPGGEAVTDLFGESGSEKPDQGDSGLFTGVLGGCGTCHACRRIGVYSHPDVIVRMPLPRPKSPKQADPADPTEALAFKAEHPYRDPDISGGNLSIGIADVRAVTRQLAYAPVEGGKRVIIFREAELMREEAQNALLKSLEEPPDHSLFILTTNRPDALLSTVRSRCRTIHFGPLPHDTISAWLRDEGFALSEEFDCAALARGSLKRAVAISEGGVPAREEALQILSWVIDGRSPQAIKWAAGHTFKSGGGAQVNARQVMDELLSLTRDVAVIQAGSDVPLMNPDQEDLLRSIGAGATAGAGIEALEAVIAARGEVDRFVNLALIYTSLFEALKPLGA